MLQQHLSRCSFVIPEPMLPATLQQHLSGCSLVTPQPLLPVPQRQPQTSHQTASALGGQNDQAGSSPGTALPKKEIGLLPRVIDNGEVGGREVKKGQVVQVRTCMCQL